MKLVLIRHGIAEERATVKPRAAGLGPLDADRRLTTKGTRRVRAAAAALRELGVRPDVVLHSGLVRARETAELVAARLRPRRSELVVTDALVPEADPQLLFDELRRLRARSVVAVGHAPNLDRVVALACGASGRFVTSLGKAAAACIELPDSGRAAGRLVWLLPPRMLRRFRKT